MRLDPDANSGCLADFARRALTSAMPSRAINRFRRARESAPSLLNHPSVPPLPHLLQWQDITMNGEENVEPVNVDPRWCVPESITRTDELIPDSIQEALRMYLQPIKNTDPKVGFSTLCKWETL